ncbi:MAG: 2,4'-dihydroxyacetophenone dioxygenase family protein [Pirellulales bacterium]|jgi:2,4'-dihydroxyacetophenone dioxygenase|nr:cupin [Rhodopirellula sp.]MCH2369790.1 2,4'-dihydroxyacetophenone dioxygenase family protein [Pirellulales bacterium]|tara:strand:- start:658 stop:1146 length:489 start_codon:yes stop_codon:yes gene_type:complete
MAYFESLPYGIADFTTEVEPEDDRLWVPQAENVWFRPLHLNRTSGQWVNLLKVRKSGVLSRHRHPAPVHGYVIRGSWRYLEHDWVATPGSYVYEPPGDVHTLVCDEGVEEMITLFHISGALIYLDESLETVGYDDVHKKIEMCMEHFEKVGLGAGYVEQFIR